MGLDFFIRSDNLYLFVCLNHLHLMLFLIWMHQTTILFAVLLFHLIFLPSFVLIEHILYSILPLLLIYVYCSLKNYWFLRFIVHIFIYSESIWVYNLTNICCIKFNVWTLQHIPNSFLPNFVIFLSLFSFYTCYKYIVYYSYYCFRHSVTF